MAGDLAAPGFDRALDHGSRVKFPIKNNSEPLVNVAFCDLAETLRGLRVQLEINFRLTQIAACDHGAFNPADHFSLLTDEKSFRGFFAVRPDFLAPEHFITRLGNALLQ